MNPAVQKNAWLIAAEVNVNGWMCAFYDHGVRRRGQIKFLSPQKLCPDDLDGERPETLKSGVPIS